MDELIRDNGKLRPCKGNFQKMTIPQIIWEFQIKQGQFWDGFTYVDYWDIRNILLVVIFVALLPVSLPFCLYMRARSQKNY